MNITNSTVLPQCAQSINDSNVSPPYLPACLTFLYPASPKIDAAFKTCCQGNPVATFSPDDRVGYDSAYPCFQYCNATSNAQEEEIMSCMVRSYISGVGAPTLSGSGRVAGVSTSGMLVMGLALMGMLQVWM